MVKTVRAIDMQYEFFIQNLNYLKEFIHAEGISSQITFRAKESKKLWRDTETHYTLDDDDEVVGGDILRHHDRSLGPVYLYF